MSEIDVHNYRDMVGKCDGQYRLIWIEAHHVLSEAQRATDQEGFDVFEPASLFHLPHGSADREDVQIAGFKKPDDAILFVALDKVLRFSNKLLLLVVCLLLLFAAILTQLQILGIIHLIIINTSHRHFDGTCCNIIHEFAVVADYDNCFPVINKEIFQPLNRFNIQMIRRLIEQEYVRFL